MSNLLCENLLAVSFMLNLWFLAYAMPKVKREVKYWQKRSRWAERYCSDLEESLAQKGRDWMNQEPGQDPGDRWPSDPGAPDIRK